MTSTASKEAVSRSCATLITLSGICRLRLTKPESVSGRLAVFEIVLTERIRKHLVHGAHARRCHDLAPGSTVLPQELPAPSAGHQRVTVAVDAGHCHKSAAAAQVQLGDHPALRAQLYAVSRILDVAAGHDAPVIDYTGYPDRELAVGRVGPPHRLYGRITQGCPVNGHRLAHRVIL